MIYTIGCELDTSSTIEECLAYFKDKPEIQIDTETSGTDPHTSKIISLQIGDRHNQWFVDCRKVDIQRFKELIENRLCILQNAKFDYKMFKAVGINLNKIYDTMLAECVLYCGYPSWGYGLDSLAKRYLEIDLSKEERATFSHVGNKEFTSAQITYGALDVTYLQDIRDKQLMLADQYDLHYCINLECEAVKAFGDMEFNGMFLDKASWMTIAEAKRRELSNIQEELDNIVKQEPKLKKYNPTTVQGNLFGIVERALKINYASPSQIKEIAKDLGFPVESTDDRELTKLAPKHPFFGKLQKYREVSKILSTYGQSFLEYINPATQRVHTDFWQVKDTGRVGSSNPNVQNIPADNLFRNCFKARTGFKWVSIDYSGQELRLMADASDEQGFIDVLNRGEDLHCYAGSMMFKRPITKADKDLRNKAKTINFGKP